MFMISIIPVIFAVIFWFIEVRHLKALEIAKKESYDEGYADALADAPDDREMDEFALKNGVLYHPLYAKTQN